MPPPHAHLLARRPREAGFTVIELVIVMVIVAILFAGVLSSSRGARDVSADTSVRGVARAYDRAIQSFADAHGGRVPNLGDEWAGERGPKEPQSQIYYLRSVPEGAGGSIKVTKGTNTSHGTRGGEVRYVRLGDRRWGMIAVWNGTITCATEDVLPALERC